MMLNLFGEAPPKTVFISEEQSRNLGQMAFYGRFYPDSNIYNVFPPRLAENGTLLGTLVPEDAPSPEGFHARAVDGTLRFFEGDEPLKIEVYHLYQSIFSRNKGILETDVMQEKRAVIIGCGSVGSLAAMELARAGVGHFLLIDADIVEYHNLCRHQCGIEDVGDLKINALARKLRSIDPFIHIETCEGVLQNVPKALLDGFCKENDTIFLGCADNRSADVYANRISIYYSCAFLSIGLWERACAGEIFYHIPGCGMPCYACALGSGDTTPRAQANHHLYSNEEAVNGISFEPGISTDISFVTLIGVKLAIDILDRGREGHLPQLLNDLKQYTIICNTSDTAIAGETVGIFSYPLQVSRSLVVTFTKEACRKEGRCCYERDAGKGR